MTKDRETIRSLIQSAGSRFCSITFVKVDGSHREMLIQPRVTSYIKGDEACDSARRAARHRAEANPNLINVWDVQKRAPRSINLDTVNRVVLDGREHLFA